MPHSYHFSLWGNEIKANEALKKLLEQDLTTCTSADFEGFRDIMPAACFKAIKNAFGNDADLDILPPNFVAKLKIAVSEAQKYDVDLLELLPEEWKRQINAKVEMHVAEAANDTIIDTPVEEEKIIEPEEAREPKVSPHEIRNRLKARGGVRLGFAELAAETIYNGGRG